MLPNYNVIDPKIDFLSQDEVMNLQEKRLIDQVHHCYKNTFFWRKKFENAGITPSDIKTFDDLSKIPFSEKEELQKDQQENPPFGSYLGVHRSTLTEFTATSGTTGRPLVRVFSERDWNINVKIALRDPFIAPGDIAVFAGPTDALFGPRSLVDRVMAMGGLAIKTSRFSSEDKVRIICDYKPSIVFGTPSLILYLADVAAKMGIDFSSTKPVKTLSLFGEPGASVPATKRRVLKKWGAKSIIDAYGLTEVAGMGSICSGSGQIHCPNDFVIVELIDPDTGEVVERGQRGELVYTNIYGETQPLLRYKSRDIGTICEFGQCPECGKTSTRIANGIEGRIDDMIWYKGVNIFPSAIESVVRNFETLSDEYEIVLDQKGERQSLTVRVEVESQLLKGKKHELKTKLEKNLAAALGGVHATIDLIPENTLPRTTHKAKRVKDNRRKNK
jgi:phenylacetate-CoA ligase